MSFPVQVSARRSPSLLCLLPSAFGRPPYHCVVMPLVAAIGAVLAPQTGAETVAREHALEHVLVTVPLHRKAAETALPVTVVSADELRRQAGATIGSVLSAQPGVSNASFGPGVGQPVIRGQSGPRVKVLQNGMTSADASVTSADHAIVVEPLLADSVEVLRGPATLLYGGGAIGGVVNVIDGRVPSKAPAAPLRGAVEYRHDGGSDGDTGVFRLDGGNDVVAWYLSGISRDWADVEIPGLAFDRRTVDDVDESSDGYIANTGGRSHSLTGGVSWLLERGFVGLAISDSESHYGIPDGGHARGHDKEEEGPGDHDDHGHGEDEHDDSEAEHSGIAIDMRQTRVDLKGEWHAHASLVDVLRAQLSHTDYEHRELEGDGEMATLFENDTWEGRLELVHHPIGDWHGVFGLQWRDTDFAATGAEAFIPASKTRAAGLFWLEDYHQGNWIYEFGVRLDRDRIEIDGSHSRSFTAGSGSASVLWSFAPAWQAGLAFSVAERAPTVEELYSNHGNADWHVDHYHFHHPVVHAATRSVEIGEESLNAEQSRNVDLSLRYAHGGVEAQVTAFHNDFHDFIYLADVGAIIDGVPVRNYRQADARFHGFEMEVKLPILATARGSADLTFYGDYVRGRLDSGGDVPRSPPWRVGARISFEHESLRAYGDLQHAAEQDRPGRNEAQTQDWHRLDLGVSYELTMVAVSTTLFLHGRNLTDEEIRLSSSALRDFAPEPGRSLEAGIRLAF